MPLIVGSVFQEIDEWKAEEEVLRYLSKEGDEVVYSR